MPASTTANASALTLSFPEPDIALLTFDLPGKGANVLSAGVLHELAGHLDTLKTRQDLKGLVIASGKPGIFIAGADLREFVASIKASRAEVEKLCTDGQALYGRLASAPYVTVAAIDGVCVGGGSELAIWCDRRVLTNNPKTEFGFPEVKLGLFPGWGGTVRTPRIIGLANAIEMVTGGESVTPKSAQLMGLASDVTSPADLIPAAIRLIREEQATGAYLRDRAEWQKPLAIDPTELGFLGATAGAMIQQQTHGNYPAPVAALELMLETSQLPVAEALQKEAQGFAGVFGTAVNGALLNVFFLTDRNKRDKGVDAAFTPAEIKSVGVIGAGIMGAGIVGANLRRGISVTLTDASAEALARGGQSALEDASFDREIKKSDPKKALQAATLLHSSSSNDEITKADLVIEAVVESAELKQSLYAKLEPLMREDAVLASNTSTIRITKLASQLKHPERFCGIHFFNPVRRMKLVEVIRGQKTSEQTVATAVAYAKRLGKMPIVVNDSPGFLVNRLLFPYLQESLELLRAGVEIKQIDRAALSFGMPIGPIALYDMVGLDTAFYAGRTMWEAFPDRVAPSPIVPALVKAGRLGEKSGKGFYSYEGPKKKKTDDPTLLPVIAAYLEPTGPKLSPEMLTHRLILPMLLEATRALMEGLVRDPRDIDLGLIFGLGFPPFRGGLLYWADTLGAAKVLEMLKPFESLGVCYQPTPLLLEMAAGGKKFYPA